MNRKRLLGCDATIFVSNVDMIAKGKLEGGALVVFMEPPYIQTG